jgi:hypothetical protein
MPLLKFPIMGPQVILVLIYFHISIYRHIPKMWRQSQYSTQYICWITDVITNTIVYKIYIINYQYIVILSCYNLEYTLFLEIKKFIHRIKWIIHKKPLEGLFEHFCFIRCAIYGSWQITEGPDWYRYRYICQLQLGKHPVAVVQYTFTHKQYIEQHK